MMPLQRGGEVSKARAKIGKVLFTREDIEARLDELAEEIEQHYGNRELTIVALLKGSLFFTVDLVRRLSLPVRVDVLEVSSYFDSTSSSGGIVLSNYLVRDVRDRHVLVLDDIVDTGVTLARTLELIRREKPKSLAACAFLNKKRRRRVDAPVDFYGFEVKARDFVVGYGLDYAQRYRNLPYLAVLEKQPTARGTSRRRAARKKPSRRPRASKKKGRSSPKRSSARAKARRGAARRKGSTGSRRRK